MTTKVSFSWILAERLKMAFFISVKHWLTLPFLPYRAKQLKNFVISSPLQHSILFSLLLPQFPQTNSLWLSKHVYCCCLLRNYVVSGMIFPWFISWEADQFHLFELSVDFERVQKALQRLLMTKRAQAIFVILFFFSFSQYYSILIPLMPLVHYQDEYLSSTQRELESTHLLELLPSSLLRSQRSQEFKKIAYWFYFQKCQIFLAFLSSCLIKVLSYLTFLLEERYFESHQVKADR